MSKDAVPDSDIFNKLPEHTSAIIMCYEMQDSTVRLYPSHYYVLYVYKSPSQLKMDVIGLR